VILAQLAHSLRHTVSSLAPLPGKSLFGFSSRSFGQTWDGWYAAVVIVPFIESIWSLAVMIDRYLYFSAARSSRAIRAQGAGALKDSKLEEAIRSPTRNKKSPPVPRL